MASRTRRAQSAKANSFPAGVVEEGAERYIWVCPEGQQVVLAIPGLRGLKFSVGAGQVGHGGVGLGLSAGATRSGRRVAVSTGGVGRDDSRAPRGGFRAG